ncbi:MAG: hypothetical protein DRQ43_02680, partial [Gammaproteobacteria bacterium]
MMLKANKKAITHSSLKISLSLIILGLWLLMVLLVPVLELHPNDIILEKILLPSDGQSFFGYDDLGRPLFDRLMVGAYTSFVITFGVIFVS